MKKLLLITTCLFTISSSVFAQHMSPAQQGFAYQQQMRMRQRQQQQNYAAQQRAQQRRQQAHINRMRNKKWYGAIVKVVGTPSVTFAAGHYSKRGAIRRAMAKSCKTNPCKVLATFSNTCAMTAVPMHDKVSIENHYIAFDKTGYNAIVKAVRACEAVHGGACSFAGVKGKNEALCAGYEYGHYGQR